MLRRFALGMKLDGDPLSIYLVMEGTLEFLSAEVAGKPRFGKTPFLVDNMRVAG